MSLGPHPFNDLWSLATFNLGGVGAVGIGPILFSMRKATVFDILVISETHFGHYSISSFSKQLSKFYGREYWCDHAPADKGRPFQGVTLIHNRARIQINKVDIIWVGRVLIARVVGPITFFGASTTKPVGIMAMYLPNDQEDRERCVRKVKEFLQQTELERVIFIGDFNIPITRFSKIIQQVGWRCFGQSLWEKSKGDQLKDGILLVWKRGIWPGLHECTGMSFKNPKVSVYHPMGRTLQFGIKPKLTKKIFIWPTRVWKNCPPDRRGGLVLAIGNIVKNMSLEEGKPMILECLEKWIKEEKGNQENPEKLVYSLEQPVTPVASPIWDIIKGIKKEPLRHLGIKSASWTKSVPARQMIDFWRPLFCKDEFTEESAAIRVPEGPIFPTIREITKILETLPGGKATGPDRISYELFRAGSKEMAEATLQSFRFWVDNPSHKLLTSNVHFLFKGKGDPGDPGAYRPITLLNADVKVLTKWLAWRMRPNYHQYIGTEQQGFHKDGWIIRNVRLLADTLLMLDDWSLRRSLHVPPAGVCILLLDLAKAFDSVEWEYMFASVSKLVPKDDALAFWIRRLYTPHYTSLLGSDGSIPVNKGVKQGDPLSPHIFNVAIQGLFDKIKAKPGVLSLFRNDGLLSAYADDIAIYMTIESVTEVLGAIAEWTNESGVKVNYNKSYALIFPGAAMSAMDSQEEMKQKELGKEVRVTATTLLQGTRFNVRVQGEESGLLPCGDYLGFPVFLNPVIMAKEIILKVKTKVDAAIARIRCVEQVSSMSIIQRVEVFNTCVMSIPIYYAMGVLFPDDFNKWLDIRARRFVWGGKLVHPGKELYYRSVSEGGFGLLPSEVVIHSTLLCGAYILILREGPQWHLLALNAARETWQRTTNGKFKWWESACRVALDVTGYPGQGNPLSDGRDTENLLRLVRREDIRKDILARWRERNCTTAVSYYGWEQWWLMPVPHRLLTFGYCFRFNRVHGGPMSHVVKQQNYVCPICGNNVAEDDSQHFATTNCEVNNEIIRIARSYGYAIDGNLKDDWLRLYDSGEDQPTLKVLSWLLYIGWYGYHRATYQTDVLARGSWMKFLCEELEGAIQHGIYGNDRWLLEWIDEMDQDYKRGPRAY